MTDTTPDCPSVTANADEAPVTPTSATPAPGKPKNRFASVEPVLEKLFELYPHLFGARFLPLKLGIYQELLAVHPETFKRDTLKAALGVHTRSTRYLQCVAAGNKRHDLLGHPVDDVAPEHVFLSIVELFHRRQARSKDDLKPKLQAQLTACYESSSLSRQDFLARLPVLDEAISGVLEQAIANVDQRRARRAALVKAFETSGKTVDEFADSLGMDVAQVRAAVDIQA